MSTLLQGSSPVIHKSSLLRSTVTGRRTSCFDVRGERRSPEFIYLVVYMSTMLRWQTRVFLNYYSLESHIVVKLKTGTRALHPRQYVKGETCTIVFLFIHSWLSSFDTFLYDFFSCFLNTDISFQMVKWNGQLYPTGNVEIASLKVLHTTCVSLPFRFAGSLRLYRFWLCSVSAQRHNNTD